MTLDIVIPAFNESRQITALFDKLRVIAFPSFIHAVQFICVNDCSTDQTKEVVEAYQQQYPSFNLLLLSHDQNKGKGAAVRTGIEAGRGDLVLIQDGDLELSPSDIPSMLDCMHLLKVEFVNGSRYLPGVMRPLYAYRRYYFNKLFTRIASVLVNVRFTDLACGYKLFTRSIYNKIQLQENRFGFEAELIIKMARQNRTLIAEVPVNYFPRNVGEGKKLKSTDGIKIFLVILKYGLFKN